MSADLPMVYVVDDEVGARDAMGWVLRSRRILFETFASAEAFIEAIDGQATQFGGAAAWPRSPSCLLLDVGMPGMSGLQLFEILVERQLIEKLPVIFLTGHGDVPMAVSALERGAFGFVEKPASTPQLLSKIEAGIEKSRATIKRRREVESMRERIKELTPREREVIFHAVSGRQNNEIADVLSIKLRTVENHRAAGLNKLAVRSAIDLMNQLRVAGAEPEFLLQPDAGSPE